MRWSKEKPTTPGYYWYRRADPMARQQTEIMIIKLEEEDGRLVTADEVPFALSKANGEFWSERIVEPPTE